MEKFIDSHCHLHYMKWNDDVIKQYSEKIKFILNVATKGSDSCHWVEEHFKATNNNKIFYKNGLFIGYSWGFHPCHNGTIENESLDIKNAMAIGEIGFDNLPTSPSIDLQIKNFNIQMELARAKELPVIIHCRDGWEVFFNETQSYKNHPIIFHCFTGDENVTKIILEEYPQSLISFSGVITYKNVDGIINSLKQVPLDRLLVETDGPFLTPYNYRKQGHKENNPLLLMETLEKIANIKNISMDDIIEQTNKNFIKIMKIII